MRKFIFLFVFLLNFAFGIELLRLGEFKDQNVSGWLASEKLDGIRAYWDGQNLLSKNGVKFATPSEFVADFPPFALDGELFISREKFELVQSVVMDKKPDILAWKDVKFYVFDVPDASGGLLSRLDVLQKFLQKQPNENIKIIEQILIPDNAWLKIFISQIIKNGGEGAVLREANAPYERKRSQNALKLKPFFDTECEVVAINQGKGKYKNIMGSLVCKDLKSKKNFKIGSGFSDEMRKNPPKIGEIITYKYQNLTKNGLPRFPVFLRIRKD
ncbi:MULTISPECIES: DNA ligase [unclassified Campylobacter]|uniref:DNA ligase n=1 Tax=unclassified Campylobacter TaxID=2593542 RepID=UPI003D33C23A